MKQILMNLVEKKINATINTDFPHDPSIQFDIKMEEINTFEIRIPLNNTTVLLFHTDENGHRVRRFIGTDEINEWFDKLYYCKNCLIYSEGFRNCPKCKEEMVK